MRNEKIRDHLVPHMTPKTIGKISIILPTLSMKEGNQGTQAQKLATSIVHYEFEAQGCRKEIKKMLTLGDNKYAQSTSKNNDYYVPIPIVEELYAAGHDSFPTVSSPING